MGKLDSQRRLPILNFDDIFDALQLEMPERKRLISEIRADLAMGIPFPILPNAARVDKRAYEKLALD